MTCVEVLRQSRSGHARCCRACHEARETGQALCQVYVRGRHVQVCCAVWDAVQAFRGAPRPPAAPWPKAS